MCTHNQCLSKNEKNIMIFHLKINIFAAVKHCCILHGCVCVMYMGFILFFFRGILNFSYFCSVT